MSTITIFNLTSRPFVFELPHSQVCVAAGRCLCNHETGAPASLRISTKGKPHTGIPSYVLRSKVVDDAVKAGKIKVFVEKEQSEGIEPSTSKITRKKKKRLGAVRS